LVVRPAALVQEPLKVAPVVSVVCVWLPVQVTGVLSVSVPDVAMVILLVYQPFEPSVPAAESTAVGPDLSILIPVRVLEAVFPARSAHVPVTDRFVPSVESVCVMGEATTPEPPSVQVQEAVTSVLFHPAPLGAVMVLKVIVGGTLSMRTVVFAEVVEFPALSWAVQFRTVVPVPVTVIVPLADAVLRPVTPLKPTVPPETRVQLRDPTDDVPSVAVTVPVIGLALNQPVPKLTVTAGAVLSMLMPFRVLEAVFPATSVQVPVTDWFAPSVVTDWVTGDVVPDPPVSVQVQLTVTFVLFQPAPLAAGARVPVLITGTTESMRTVVFGEVVVLLVSCALQVKTVAPWPFTVIVPLAECVFKPVTPPRLTVPPETRLQVRDVIKPASVAVTVPVAGLFLNQPLFPFGVNVMVTDGATLSVRVISRLF
jgi:hypothetical protein